MKPERSDKLAKDKFSEDQPRLSRSAQGRANPSNVRNIKKCANFYLTNIPVIAKIKKREKLLNGNSQKFAKY